MALNDTAKNAMLTELGTLVTHLSLHSGTEGSGSGNELTGGSPAYARQAVTWGTAASGSMAMTGTETWDLPASTVSRVGLFSAVTAGTFYGDGNLTDEVFAGQGQYQLTALTLSITG